MTLEQIKTVDLPIKATVRSYKGTCELFYYDNNELVAWTTSEGHCVASVGYYKKTKPVDNAQAVSIIKDYNQHYNANIVYSSRLNH